MLLCSFNATALVISTSVFPTEPWDRHRGRVREEGAQREAQMQTLQVVPGQRLSFTGPAGRPGWLRSSESLSCASVGLVLGWSPLQAINPFLSLLLLLQLTNNLKPDLCIDQGPVPGNTPIVYSCHYYTHQVRSDRVQATLLKVSLLISCPGLQHCYYRNEGQLYITGIQSHKYSSNSCLVDPGTGYPGLYKCNVAQQKNLHMLWDFKQVNT